MADTSNLFKGILSAALTPLTSNLEPDHTLGAAHCKWLLENGCDGLVIFGTTGEANSFSVGERIDIINNLIDHGISPGVMMPGTGCCSITDTVELTRAAVEAGSPGVLMLPPFYYKNVSDDGLFASYSEVIQRVADSRLKIYLYHIPQISNTPISTNLIEMLVRAYPDTVVGMKDSSGIFENMVEVMKAVPGFVVLAGADDLLLPHLKNGGHGCISGCANVSARLNAEVYAGWKKGEDVSKANEKLCAVRDLIGQFALSPALKHLMARHSKNVEWLNIRPPLTMFSDAIVQELYSGFDALNFDIVKAG